MIFNEEKTEQVLKCLQSYYKNSKKEIAKVEFPKTINYQSEEWLIYMFYSCLLDYGMRSKIYHQNLINTYLLHSEIFNPKYVIDNFSENKEGLFKIIKENIHPRYPSVATEKWLKLSYELTKYDNLFTHIKSMPTFDDLNQFIKQINGYGQKTGGLLLRLIYEAKIPNFQENLKYIPLDRHDIEISYLNNITDSKKLTPKQIEDLSNFLIKVGEKLEIKAEDLDKYLWDIGNSFCNHKKCTDCPLKNSCKKKEENL